MTNPDFELESLRNRPIITDEMSPYVEAFYTLSATRTCGFGPNPIQLSEMESYIRMFGCEDARLFVKFISIMDLAILEKLRGS